MNASLKLLNDTKFSPNDSELISVQAHSGNPGIGKAYNKVRSFADWAVDESGSLITTKDSMMTYHGVTNHFKLERRTSPLRTEVSLKGKEVTWRRLQKRSLLNASLLAHIYPNDYNPNCKRCGQLANYGHILWD